MLILRAQFFLNVVFYYLINKDAYMCSQFFYFFNKGTKAAFYNFIYRVQGYSFMCGNGLNYFLKGECWKKMINEKIVKLFSFYLRKEKCRT